MSFKRKTSKPIKWKKYEVDDENVVTKQIDEETTAAENLKDILRSRKRKKFTDRQTSLGSEGVEESYEKICRYEKEARRSNCSSSSIDPIKSPEEARFTVTSPAETESESACVHLNEVDVRWFDGSKDDGVNNQKNSIENHEADQVVNISSESPFETSNILDATVDVILLTEVNNRIKKISRKAALFDAEIERVTDITIAKFDKKIEELKIDKRTCQNSAHTEKSINRLKMADKVDQLWLRYLKKCAKYGRTPAEKPSFQLQ